MALFRRSKKVLPVKTDLPGASATRAREAAVAAAYARDVQPTSAGPKLHVFSAKGTYLTPDGPVDTYTEDLGVWKDEKFGDWRVGLVRENEELGPGHFEQDTSSGSHRLDKLTLSRSIAGSVGPHSLVKPADLRNAIDFSKLPVEAQAQAGQLQTGQGLESAGLPVSDPQVFAVDALHETESGGLTLPMQMGVWRDEAEDWKIGPLQEDAANPGNWASPSKESIKPLNDVKLNGSLHFEGTSVGKVEVEPYALHEALNAVKLPAEAHKSLDPSVRTYFAPASTTSAAHQKRLAAIKNSTKFDDASVAPSGPEY